MCDYKWPHLVVLVGVKKISLGTYSGSERPLSYRDPNKLQNAWLEDSSNPEDLD